MEPLLEVRFDKLRHQWGIYESGVNSDDPLVMFQNEQNARLVLSQMLVQPEVMLYTMALNRIATALYDTAQQ